MAFLSYGTGSPASSYYAFIHSDATPAIYLPTLDVSQREAKILHMSVLDHSIFASIMRNIGIPDAQIRHLFLYLIIGRVEGMWKRPCF